MKKIVNTLSDLFQMELLISSLIAFLLGMVLFATAAKAETEAAKTQPGMIKIDGSSTVFPITEAVSEEYQGTQKGKIKVTVGISGTGGGFKKFCRGETDIQNASRPIQSSEMETCKAANIRYFELPVGYDATVVVVNPKNDWVKDITVEELKKMWEPSAQNKVMTWKQVNPKWPDVKITLYGAGSDSGTFDYFTEAIVGKAKASRGDYTASEDDNTLVTGIANDKSALGYLPLSYYEENKGKLKILGIVGGEKSPKKMAAVLPTKATIESGEYYPLSRPIFIYINEASSKRSEVMGFAQYYLKNAAKLVPEVKYIALPAKAYDISIEHLSKGKLGTMFGGHSEVGLKIEDLLKREGKL